LPGPRISNVPRRSVLKTAAGIAAGAVMEPLTAFGGDGSAPVIKLRVLGTSDLHMFIYDYDYFRDKPDDTVGLAKTVSLIDAARSEAHNSLLFDNGDIIQGNPLGDYMAYKHGLKPGDVHPMFKAMNLLGYDAATLGNHEFNYGLEFLRLALAGANFPFVSANILAGPSGTATYLPPTLMLDRTLTDEAGVTHPLKIGVIGFVPPQIVVWDKSNLDGKLRTRDIVETAREHVPRLKTAGADIVVALCHSGIGTGSQSVGEENASFHLAAIPGIDAILTGHSHRVFPGPDYADRSGIDAVRGTLNGVPAVMPGFWGSHLGIIDLTLTGATTGWTVTDFTVEARPIYRREGAKVVALIGGAARITAAAETEHADTLSYIRQPVGKITAPINSYFAQVADDPSVEIVNLAQAWYLRQLAGATPWKDVPILSAAAPFKAGGGYGIDNYTDIPAGDIAIKNIADLYVYPNMLRAVLIDGAGVREWLERAAGMFNRIDPAITTPQELINSRFVSYNFDVMWGVTYRIDVTQPSRYGPDGKVERPDAHRIVDLRFADRPIDPKQRFLVATNNYRASGGGKFPGLDGSSVVIEAPDTNRDVIIRYVVEQRVVNPSANGKWRFEPIKRPVKVVFETAPAARAYADRYPAVSFIGPAANGFAQFSLSLA